MAFNTIKYLEELQAIGSMTDICLIGATSKVLTMFSPTLSGTSWTQEKVMAVLSCLFQMRVMQTWKCLSGGCTALDTPL